MTAPRSLANGRYALERTLGGGGMATVHLARDTQLDREVAIKILSPDLAGEEDVRARFVREARLAARLSHPNVVAVFDTGEDDGLPYIVMEHVPGETLLAVISRRGRLPAAEVRELAVQACAGLEHAHAAGLVHRDVKPANLLRRDDGAVKITDFGIARAAEASRVTEVGTVLGTAAYLAPEQASGGEVSAVTDVYSLGAVLYECLTGSRPYTFDSLAELGRKQAEESIAPVSQLAPETPPALADAVMRALERSPSRRHASAADFGRALSEEAEAPTRVLAPARPSKARYAPIRRRRVLGAALAVAAATAAVAIGLAAADDDTPTPAPPAAPDPPAPGATPEQTARNLADWLRSNARD